VRLVIAHTDTHAHKSSVCVLRVCEWPSFFFERTGSVSVLCRSSYLSYFATFYFGGVACQTVLVFLACASPSVFFTPTTTTTPSSLSLSLSLSSENAARADDTPPPQIQDGFTDANGRSRARGWRPAGCQERGHGRGARRGRRDPRRYVTETPVARVSTDPNGAGRDREKVCRVGRQDRQDTLCQGCHPQL